jgi:glutamyl/glutaminyl-tRNA synthetase
MRTIFSYDAGNALGHDRIRAEMNEPEARRIVAALADDLQTSPRLSDRETFRAAVARVKERTGLKGRTLLHPIRVVLTGEPEGPELDLIVPAIDRATTLSPADGLQTVSGSRERAAAMDGLLA